MEYQMMRQHIFEKRKRQTPKMTFVFVLKEVGIPNFFILELNLHNLNYVINYKLSKAFFCSSLTIWVYKSVTCVLACPS